MKKHILFIVPLFFIASCTAKSTANVEAFMFKSVPAERSNDYTSEFLSSLAGTYLTSEGVEFTIPSSGTFTLDGITYSLHSTASEKHGVFKAETPIEGKSQKMITYHGISIDELAVYSAGLKKDLDYSKTPKFYPEDTPYASKLNAQRIENIDFDASKATRFGTRVS